MQKNLTLRLDAQLINRAKAVAKQSGKSVSQMVANYFNHLVYAESKVEELTPTVRSLLGVLRDSDVDLEYCDRYLREKNTVSNPPA